MFKKYWHGLVVIFAFIVGVSLSVFASLVLEEWEEKSRQAERQVQLNNLATAINTEINRNLEMLRAMEAFFGTYNEITQPHPHLQQFIRKALYRHTSIEAVALVQPVLEEDRLVFEETVSAEINRKFEIIEKISPGITVPALPRPLYFPNCYSIAYRSASIPLGFDFASQPLYKATLNRAAATGEIIATPPVRSLETGMLSSTIFLFMPIFNPGINPDLEVMENLGKAHRENSTPGFAAIMLRGDEILRTAVQYAKISPGIDVYLEDAMAPVGEKLLAIYQGNSKQIVTAPGSSETFQSFSRTDCPDGSGCTRILQVENRRWLLRLLLNPDYDQQQKRWRPIGALVLGMILTHITIAYLLVLLRYTKQVEKAVAISNHQSQELQEALDKLQQTQAQLIHTEKMSSLGKLVAGVAHEINNPINFIYANIYHVDKYVQELLTLVKMYSDCSPSTHPQILEYTESIDVNFLQKDLQKITVSMKSGSDRIIQIVNSMRNFSRLDESQRKMAKIHEGIDSTLVILESKIKQAGITVEKHYGCLPEVLCYPGALNQVFMNLLDNAIDAIEAMDDMNAIFHHKYGEK
ncbi:MAG TPA: CHASE domain-containing protein [Oscillatoriaceae cyanobacterium M33_DOE_052]|uniref:Histidine kinase n=1 Tax=Planktothricoides sp. SpSt-374 TaxID=2282167 RepID=A0A7C3VIA5_9CYAN|nr:CHASE domain-containing protein [Oscillatoriaceae cyanobacterium M33_DOE_052]